MLTESAWKCRKPESFGSNACTCTIIIIQPTNNLFKEETTVIIDNAIPTSHLLT